MNSIELNLAHKLAASHKWRWMEGMGIVYTRDRDGAGRAGTRDRVESLHEDDGVKLCSYIMWVEPGDVGVPDLSDPATIGCIGALIDRELEGKPARRWPRSPERLDTKGARRAWFLLLLWGERVR